MSVGLYSGVSGLALGIGLYKGVSGLWGGASGLIDGFGGGSPFDGASLYLNFLIPSLDPRVTFTRGSNATLVDATGKITYAPANLLLRSEEFDNAAWTKSNAAVLPFNPAAATSGPELRGTGAVGLFGTATAATYNPSTGVGTCFRVDASNQSFVTFTGLNSASYYAVVITCTSAAVSMSVRSGAFSGVPTGVLFTGQSRTVYCNGATSITLTDGGGGGSSFTVTSINELSGGLIVAPDGTSTADKLVADLFTSTHYALQSATVTASTHILSVYAKAGEQSFVSLGFDSLNAWFNLATGTLGTVEAGLTGVITAAGNGWYRCSVIRAVSVAGSKSSVVYSAIADNSISYTGNSTSGIFIWGAQLEPVTYQTTPSTYVATTSAAYYGPRFDYDPVTLAPKGLLIEEARTNLLTYSDDWTNAAWTKNLVTAAANATTSPDGTSNADRLTETATSGEHFTSQQIAKAASSITYTQTAYFKNGSGTRNFALGITDGTTGGYGAIFSTSGAVVSASFAIGVTAGWTFVSSAVTPAGNGWYRASLTVTSNVAIRLDGVCYLVSGTTTSYAGDGTSNMFLYGAQLEATAFATSYIPTVASQVTRSADIATMTGTNFSSWYNATEGSLLAEVLIASKSGSYGIYAVDDGTTNNAFPSFHGGTAQANARVGGAGVFSGQSAALPATPAVLKIGFAYATSNYAASFNGGTLTTQLSGAIPSGLNRLQIGAYNGIQLNGHIRSIAYYNTRLSNTQLQTLTAPSLATTLSMSFTNQAYTVGV